MFNRVRHKIDRCLRSAELNRAASRLWLPARQRKNAPAAISEAGRILVIKPDGIGDLVLASGFLRSLRRQCPHARITIAVRPAFRELVDHPCFGDEIMLWKEEWHGLASQPGALINLIQSARDKWRANSLDWVLIPRSGWDHANASVYAWWTGAANVCAHEYFCADRGLRRHGFFNQLIPTATVMHETGFHRRMLEFLRLDPGVDPQLEIPASAQNRVHELLAELRIPATRIGRMAFGMGASHGSKRWPAEHFKTLAHDLVHTQPGLKIFLIGDHADQAIARRIQKDLPGSIFDLTGKLSLSETAALLQWCEIYVGNDSGPVHLAGAAGCAVVEVSKHPVTGSADHECSPVRFGPVAKWSCVLQPQPRSAVCQAGCNEPGAHCIADITVDQVKRAVSAAGLAVGQGRQP